MSVNKEAKRSRGGAVCGVCECKGGVMFTGTIICMKANFGACVSEYVL